MREFRTLDWVFSNLPNSGFAPDSPSVALSVDYCTVRVFVDRTGSCQAIVKLLFQRHGRALSGRGPNPSPLHVASPTSKFVS